MYTCTHIDVCMPKRKGERRACSFVTGRENDRTPLITTWVRVFFTATLISERDSGGRRRRAWWTSRSEWLRSSKEFDGQIDWKLDLVLTCKWPREDEQLKCFFENPVKKVRLFLIIIEFLWGCGKYQTVTSFYKFLIANFLFLYKNSR